jgi:hypothetical protein
VIIHDFSNWPESLMDFAITQFQSNGWLVFDESNRRLNEAPNAHDLRIAAHKSDNFAYWLWWLRFGTGVECLVKAVFLNHEISLIRKKEVATKALGQPDAPSTVAAAKVYTAVAGVQISSKSNSWLSSELSRLGISHPLEINSETLGKYRDNLGKLEQKGKISAQEKTFLENALMTLADIRRNVDAHVFLKTQVGGSINGDLSDVYIPACNILIEAFSR